MKLKRSCGVLLHPTSFPGKYGIGDLGPNAYTFIDFLSESKQKLWQILPLNYPGYGNSPYNPISAFAGNPSLISPEKLIEKGYIATSDLPDPEEFDDEKVLFDKVISYKRKILEKAFSRFMSNDPHKQLNEFDTFCYENAHWLDDLSLFVSLRQKNKYASWNNWNRDIKLRKDKALILWRNKLAEQIRYHKFVQFLFHEQWRELVNYAHSKNIQIIGDIPIYIAYDSADVWANQGLFYLDEDGNQTYIAGVPPDAFSEDGQIWGNPLYDWKKMQQNDYLWWRERISHLLTLVDYARIDHFIGFVRFLKVEPGSTTTRYSEWEQGPDAHFFSTMKKYFGKLPIIAEDLGMIIPRVYELRDEFDLPGMKILQYSFAPQDTRPDEYEENSVVYPGTHDNDMIKTWVANLKMYEPKIYQTFTGYIKYDEKKSICWQVIACAYAAPSKWAIIQMQDILCLDSSARMNRPGTLDDNWDWRFTWDMIKDGISDKLCELVEKYNR